MMIQTSTTLAQELIPELVNHATSKYRFLRYISHFKDSDNKSKTLVRELGASNCFERHSCDI
jgi:hypothetical protein